MTDHKPSDSGYRPIIILLLLFSILLLSSPGLAQIPINFSGKWVYDKDKSDLGKGAFFRVEESTLAISQDIRTLTIERNVKRENQENYSRTEKFSLNGKETITENNDIRTKTSTKWVADKESLIITYIMTLNSESNRNEHRTDNTYSLSKDGNTLTIKSISFPPVQQIKMILVYNRVE